DVRGQGRVEAAEDAGEIAAFRPSARAHAGDGKIGHRDVAGLDVDEQGRRQQLRAQGAQQRCLADTGGSDYEDLGTVARSQALVRGDDLHSASFLAIVSSCSRSGHRLPQTPGLIKPRTPTAAIASSIELATSKSAPMVRIAKPNAACSAVSLPPGRLSSRNKAQKFVREPSRSSQ